MLGKPSRWACTPYDVAAAARLAAALGVSRTLAAVLVRRGLHDPAAARRFLAAGERHDPGSLPGAPAAVATLLRHLERGSRIVVFGDYDVDGVCSTAMLVGALRALGADPRWELPSRLADGYGLSAAAAERLAAQGAELLVTVDCGITAVAEVAAARAAGMEVVVSDHHRPGAALPDCTVVHPGLGAYGTPELCAAGVVLKLVEALFAAAGRDPRGAEDALDLAALATVCDVVPLRGENRRIVRAGLEALARTRRPGLRALMREAALEPGEVDEGAVGFRLGPRLNAAGRMGRADAALELLLTEDESRAEQIARELDGLNRDRREAETRILFQADAACAEQASAAALVVAGEGWHPGVVGIVASRLVERWCRPCVAIALEGERGRGSGRSIAPYDLHAGLAACERHLRRFGGHRAAAGLELEAGAVDGFRCALASHAAERLSPSELVPIERVDAVVPGGALGLPLAEQLELLRPFGMGNREPTLLVPAARVEAVSGMGEGRHARFTVVSGGARSRGVAFGTPPRALSAASGPHDVALRLERHRWNGAVEPRLVLRALCPTEPGPIRVLGEDASFWERLERELRRDPAGEAPAADAPPRDGAAAAANGDPAAESPPPDAPPRNGAGAAANGDPARDGRRSGRRPALADRRGEGLAGVAGDLLTSGEPVLVAVADVPRRRAALESLVADLAPDGLAVACWSALAADPALAAPFAHLLAFDPPPGGERDTLLGAAPLAHLAWGPAEVDFALGVWRAALELRPALADAWRALRALPAAPSAAELEAALRGGGPYPRAPETCGRLVRVLGELELVDYLPQAAGGPRCAPRDAARTELERSPAYRAYRAGLAAAERALARAGRPAPGAALAAAAPL